MPQPPCPSQSPMPSAPPSHSSRPQGGRASAGPRPGTSFPRGLAPLRQHLWHRENSVPTVGSRHTSAHSKVWAGRLPSGWGTVERGLSSPQIRMWVLVVGDNFNVGRLSGCLDGRERETIRLPAFGPTSYRCGRCGETVNSAGPGGQADRFEESAWRAGACCWLNSCRVPADELILACAGLRIILNRCGSAVWEFAA